MIATCPACQTRFRLPDDALGAVGRRLRCGACRHVWFEAAPQAGEAQRPEPIPPAMLPGASAASTPPPVESAGEVAGLGRQESELDLVVPRADPPPRPAQRRSGRVLMYLAALLALAAAGWALHAERGRVMGQHPWSVPLYDALGLAAVPSSLGLELRDVSFAVVETDGMVELVVSGTILNTGRDYRSLPALTAELLDGEHRTLASWRFAAPVAGLAAREEAAFSAAWPDPPRDDAATHVFVGFEDAR